MAKRNLGDIMMEWYNNARKAPTPIPAGEQGLWDDFFVPAGTYANPFSGWPTSYEKYLSPDLYADFPPLDYSDIEESAAAAKARNQGVQYMDYIDVGFAPRRPLASALAKGYMPGLEGLDPYTEARIRGQLPWYRAYIPMTGKSAVEWAEERQEARKANPPAGARSGPDWIPENPNRDWWSQLGKTYGLVWEPKGTNPFSGDKTGNWADSRYNRFGQPTGTPAGGKNAYRNAPARSTGSAKGAPNGPTNTTKETQREVPNWYMDLISWRAKG